MSTWVEVLLNVFVGTAGALVVLLVGGCIIRWRDRLRAGQYRTWRHLMWIPKPIYYWLLDRYTDNDGWRPLFYRNPAHARRANRKAK